MNRRRIARLVFAAAAAGLTVGPVMAAVTPVAFTGSYGQNFDSMGTTGTAAPAGWGAYSLSGSHSTFSYAGDSASDTVTFLPSSTPTALNVGTGSSTLSAITTLTAATPAGQKGAGAYNFAAAATPNDRTLGTSPSGNAATELQLSLTNATPSAIGDVTVGYDIDRFTTTVDNNGFTTSPYYGVEELPGYQLFYSLDSGATWNNVAALNPTLNGSSGVVVPNSVGTTTVPATDVTLSGPWAAGATLELRWVDDNAESPSPDQLLGLNNVTITAATSSVPEPTTVGLATVAAAGLLAGRRRRSRLA